MTKGVLFDMDGTITRPHIDFKALRAEIGVPEGTPIMAHVDALGPGARERANAAIEAVELDAAKESTLNPGAAELLEGLRGIPVKLGLITNSNRRAMLVVVGKFDLKFDLLLSREDAPLKPAPDLLFLALEKLGLTPETTVFVGDGHYDRAASAAAKVRYIHLEHSYDGNQNLSNSTVFTLSEVWNHLKL
jgi:HAD superfamily hydrolase (TIGR01549 family)